MVSMRSGLGTRMLYTSLSAGRRFHLRGSAPPSTSTSSERIAFWKDSWKVRPMAMASPTLFICSSSNRRGTRAGEQAARHPSTRSRYW